MRSKYRDAAKHCGTAKRIDEARNATAMNAQKKKRSARQKVDKRSARLSAVDYATEFQQLTNTSTATVAMLSD
jgi:hypothetical protein